MDDDLPRRICAARGFTRSIAGGGNPGAPGHLKTMVVTNAKETWHVRIGIAEVWRYSIHMGLNVGSPNDIGQVLNGKKKSSLPTTTIPQMSISSESF